jgi:hypothetical protein
MRLLLAAIAGCAAPLPDAPLVPPPTLDAASRSSDATFPGGIRVELGGQYCLPSHDAVAIQSTISRITNVLAVYPARILDAGEIAEISVCAEIHNERGPAWGLADWRAHRFLISIESDVPTVHHELFHMIDRNTLLQTTDPDDSMWIQWPRVNPEGFQYGDHATLPAGFVNLYAATDDEEDRASTFGMLMSAADGLCELARGDEVLRAKVRLLWRHTAAIAGTDEFLRRAAPCVDWID